MPIQINGAPQALGTTFLGDKAPRRIQHGGSTVGRIEGLGTRLRATQRIEPVIAPVHQAGILEHLATDQGVGGVGRIHHIGSIAYVRRAVDFRANQEFIHAAIATGDDDHIVLGHFHHGHGVVDRSNCDIKTSCGQTRTLLIRVGREL